MARLKTIWILFAISVSLLISLFIISFDNTLEDAKWNLYKNARASYILIDEPIEYGIPLKKYFTVENHTEDERFLKIFWNHLENDYPQDAITYKLEYRVSDKNTWITAEPAKEFVPNSTLKEPLAEGLVIESNSSLQFKLTLINENPKGKYIEPPFRTSIILIDNSFDNRTV